MNSFTPAETAASRNWNSTPLPIMSFVGLETTNQKPYWDWETSSHTLTAHNSNNPFFQPSISFFDFSSPTLPLPPSPSLPPHWPTSATFNPSTFSQITDYPPTFLKMEDACFAFDGGGYTNGRIGLNLGHRTYFSSHETAVIDRLLKRSRGFYHTSQVPRCQAEDCKVDLSNAKHYHRRHNVCEFHSKATKVMLAGGLEQRFCQQCSRFHALSEFDEVKRSCRKRLADHNRRRRKPQPPGSAAKDDPTPPSKAAPNGTDNSEAAATQATKVTRASSPLPLLIAKVDHDQRLHQHFEQKVMFAEAQPWRGPALSLGGGVGAFEMPTYDPHQQHFSGFNEGNGSNDHHQLLYSSSNDASQSTGGRSSEQSHQSHLELHNLLRLGHAMFEVEIL